MIAFAPIIRLIKTVNGELLDSTFFRFYLVFQLITWMLIFHYLPVIFFFCLDYVVKWQRKVEHVGARFSTVKTEMN